MGFWSAIGSAFKAAAPIIAIDTLALLLKGGSKQSNPDQLKDKAFRSDAYNTPWARCRGVVRLQGKDLWGTGIKTSYWKTVSGGLFGIGSTSVTYAKYSASRFIGFGKKLNGGAAVRFLRIWADGKLLFNAQASTGSITGSVVTTTVGGGQLPGSQVLQIDVASGASATINAGDLIQFPGDPSPYTAQADVSGTGPVTLTVPIWPPLRVNVGGGGAVTIPPVSSSPYDLSSFDPNPHDGSHQSSGPSSNPNFNCPPGGIRFYLGSDTQTPDPLIINGNPAGVPGLGAGNSPGYTGLVAVMIHDLQLINYGDHFPAITAEIAFDVASNLYPNVGPVSNANLVLASLFPEFIALPSSGTGGLSWFNPLTQRVPHLWVFSRVGEDSINDGTVYRINTQNNQLEQSQLIPNQGTFRLTGAGMVADNDGFLYFIQDNDVFTKLDGTSLGVVYQRSFGFPNDPLSIYCFDTVQSLFGNNTIFKLAWVSNWIFDRTVLLRLGVANPASLENVVTGYYRNSDGTAQPIIAAGNPFSLFVNSPTRQMTDDSSGDIWMSGGSSLLHIDCQFINFIDISNPTSPRPMFLPPTFNVTTIDITSIVNGGSGPTIQFYPGDNTIVVFGVHKMGKVDVNTNSIVQTAPATYVNELKMAQTYDPMGGIVVATSTTPAFVRVDLSSLTELGTYDLSNFVPPGTGLPSGGYAVYDPYTDSIWYDADNNGGSYGGLNRAFLDRGKGTGIGLDSIVSTLMLEAGYSSGQFDVTQLTAAGTTCYGVEFERETFLDSLRKLMQTYPFDAAEIDGKLVFVPRGNASIVTIPEDDLGALDDPSNYEPRLFELLEDERDVPVKVTVKYYDPLKDSQPATQEFKRTLDAYASSLSGAKVNTASRQEVDIVTPITEHALQMKQQAYKILWDMVAGRYTRKAKLGWKYLRYDPTDVVTFDYKGMLLETRLTECDFGSGLAREFNGVSQDVSAYDASSVVAAPGTGSGTSTPTIPAPPPPPTPVSYTVSPTFALSQASPTEVDMVRVTVKWSDGRTTIYAARDSTTSPPSGFTVSDPGAGNSQLYYVNIYDPNRVGEVPGTPSLTAYCDTTPTLVHLGQSGYVFIGTITITHTATGVVVTSGGSQNINQAQGFYVNGGGGSQYQTQIDLLSYLINAQAATKHLTGSAFNSQAANIYCQHDPTTHSVAQIKSASGWANDIQLYFSDRICQFITELDDPGYRLWSDPSSYKKYQTPLIMMPRYATPGVAMADIVNSGSNPFDRYTSCGLIDTINRGVVTCRNYIAMLNFDSDGVGGGNLGTISTLVHERYAGNSRERMYWGLNLGFVKWDAATLISGSQITGVYKITNWSVHNKLVSGGGVTSSFACGYGVGWP